jgi:hypothetical protein
MAVAPKQLQALSDTDHLAPLKRRLAERARAYLADHPEERPDQLFLEAIDHELDRRQAGWDGAACEPAWPVPASQPVTEEDVRVHLWLNGRLAEVSRRQRGWWRSALDFLSGGLFRG